jgi:hypothetical protein
MMTVRSPTKLSRSWVLYSIALILIVYGIGKPTA